MNPITAILAIPLLVLCIWSLAALIFCLVIIPLGLLLNRGGSPLR